MPREIAVTSINCINEKLPDVFDEFRILHISDIHNEMFGTGQSYLLQCTREAKPDMIAITGDMIDKRRTDIDAAMAYVSQAVHIAPVYFVAGNHEVLTGQYAELSEKLSDCGVTVLDDKCEFIDRDSCHMAIAGVYDPVRRSEEEYERALNKITSEGIADYRILLAHKPRLSTYSRYNIDLVLSGHAHGGQWRMPLIGGLYAPDQGIFPKYTSGMHTENGTAMVVSRGLGNSVFPMRLFNGPELVAVTLRRE